MPLSWLIDNYIEVLGALAGFIYLYFSIRRIIYLWPLGIITSAFYVYIFFESRFYAGMSLQFYYFFISFYGWFTWRNEKAEQGSIEVKSVGIRQILIYILLTFILTFLISLILINFTDSPIPVWDAFTTAGSIVATYMLAQRILQNWLFWVVVDLVSLGLYFYKGLYPTLVLFFVYSVMAVFGYVKWKETLKKAN